MLGFLITTIVPIFLVSGNKQRADETADLHDSPYGERVVIVITESIETQTPSLGCSSGFVSLTIIKRCGTCDLLVVEGFYCHVNEGCMH